MLELYRESIPCQQRKSGELETQRAKNSGMGPSVGMSAARGMEDTPSVEDTLRCN